MSATLSPGVPPWQLASEAIAVRIRWFGLLVGYLYVNFGSTTQPTWPLNAILTLGLAFTCLDTRHSWRGRVFLADYPLAVSFMEALFIGLLCHFDTGIDSPFRFYYLLSLICCAMRHETSVTYITCALDCLSYGSLFLVEPPQDRKGFALILMLVVLVWVSWAADALSRITKKLLAQLNELNAALLENQAQLENRIDERTRELQETQAQVMHQDKMAGFGLLAAGIAHEVGNPLTSISSLLQIMEKRNPDDYTRSKLSLIGGQLTRIQRTLRELMDFSRPAYLERGHVEVREIVDGAMNIAKYYKGVKSRTLEVEVPEGLPHLHGIRDQLVQVVFNLVLNAIDATGKGGRIRVEAAAVGPGVEIRVIDDGPGIPPEQRAKLFVPYFTTKNQGTGLGLFVSQRMVRAHGGDLRHEAPTAGGTLFRVWLPAADNPPRLLPPAVAHAPQPEPTNA